MCEINIFLIILDYIYALMHNLHPNKFFLSWLNSESDNLIDSLPELIGSREAAANSHSTLIFGSEEAHESGIFLFRPGLSINCNYDGP